MRSATAAAAFAASAQRILKSLSHIQARVQELEAAVRRDPGDWWAVAEAQRVESELDGVAQRVPPWRGRPGLDP